MKDKNSKYNDETLAASKYILRFYDLVIQLNQQKSLFKNLLKDIKSNYEITKKIQLTEEHTYQIKQHATNTTFLIDQTYTHYSTLKGQLKENDQEKDTQIKTLMNHFNKEAIPEIDKIDNFCILINDFLITDGMKELTLSSKDILEETYG